MAEMSSESFLISIYSISVKNKKKPTSRKKLPVSSSHLNDDMGLASQHLGRKMKAKFNT